MANRVLADEILTDLRHPAGHHDTDVRQLFRAVVRQFVSHAVASAADGTQHQHSRRTAMRETTKGFRPVVHHRASDEITVRRDAGIVRGDRDSSGQLTHHGEKHHYRGRQKKQSQSTNNDHVADSDLLRNVPGDHQDLLAMREMRSQPADSTTAVKALPTAHVCASSTGHTTRFAAPAATSATPIMMLVSPNGFVLSAPKQPQGSLLPRTMPATPSTTKPAPSNATRNWPGSRAGGIAYVNAATNSNAANTRTATGSLGGKAGTSSRNALAVVEGLTIFVAAALNKIVTSTALAQMSARSTSIIGSPPVFRAGRTNHSQKHLLVKT